MWVKRDSNFAKGNQGLKAITKRKLGYDPEDIDPEEMCGIALNDPDRMAKYSVSDAVATYFIATKFVINHIYTLCSLVPFSPYDAICSNPDTLCEALLIKEASIYNVLIPSKRVEPDLLMKEGYAIEKLTPVQFMPDHSRVGLFRSDFIQKFNINEFYVDKLIEKLDEILSDFKNEQEYEYLKSKIRKDLEDSKGKFHGNGALYKIDLGELCSSLISTNKLQPTSIVDNDTCIRCEYNNDANKCKLRFDWSFRTDFYPTTPKEVIEIKEKLVEYHPENPHDKEDNHKKNKYNEDSTRYEDMTDSERSKLLKSKIIEYSKKNYNSATIRKTETQTTTVCQREVPFFVNAIIQLQKKINHCESEQISALKNTLGLPKKAETEFDVSLSTYKSILEWFHEYITRNNSRWYSIESVGIVGNLCTKLQKTLKQNIDNIGLVLDVDTNYIWTLLPVKFPNIYKFESGQEISFIKSLLSYFIDNEFINNQYQEKIEGKYEIIPRNDIRLSLNGPYKGIFFPATLREDKCIKKRHIVLNNDNSIALMKGFEMVRNGEIKIVRQIQEAVISEYGSGHNIESCFTNLANVAYKYLNVIYSEGKDCDDNFILEMITDTKCLYREINPNDKPSIIVMAARRMGEVLGVDVIKQKVRVDYIISKYPANLNIPDRVIPTIIFNLESKNEFIKKWCLKDYTLKELIDWKYYKNSVERNVKRLIVLPAIEHGLQNPISEIKVTKESSKTGVNYKTLDYALKGANIVAEKVDNIQINSDIKSIKDKWKSYYEKLRYKRGIFKIEIDKTSNEVVAHSINSILFRNEIYKTIFLDVPKQYCLKNKIDLQKGYFPCSSREDYIPFIKIKNSEFITKRQNFDRLFQHIATKKVYEMNIDPLIVELSGTKEVAKDLNFLILTTFNYNNEIVYLFSRNNSFEVFSKFKNELCRDIDVMKWFVRNRKDVLFLNKKDPNLLKLNEMFKSYNTIFVEGTVLKTLSTFKELINKQQALHSCLTGKIRNLFDISVYSNVPLTNIGSINLLDVIFLRELRKSSTFCDLKGDLSLTSFKTEICHPAYIKKYTVMFECVGSLILSIVQYKKIITQAKTYSAVNRRDFFALYNLVNNVLSDYSNNKRGAESVLNMLSMWILKDSDIISRELRDVCDLIHQRFILNLVAKLTKLGIKIVFVSRNIFCIETDKEDLKGCTDFFDYLQEKITTYEGYEFLCLRKLHFFEKLLLFNPANYFYVKNSEIFGFSNTQVPSSFLNKLFNDEIKNTHFIYDLVTRCDEKASEVILNSLNLLKGFEHVISDCYRLLKRNEFEQSNKIFSEMLIYCRECKNENIMRERCIKCGVHCTREEINETVEKYFSFYLNLEQSDDSFCDKCNRINERVLYDVCKCGGTYKKTSYKQILVYLISLLTNEQSKKHSQKALKFYGLVKN
ncbi:DNA polymerase epsilon catalytic subunit A [Nosema bombycis CQ1]|uniref:DNA polymerase epsilon catalytic subunit n=1 Tax=Nosema bombycis (strain CQ1 / CVCC 102059) TaxID=578461 RepID=R0KPJ3_NOSB1|nr:DNA polymerase epsilon catalytic subunit A [Nosema bombycis CQ1]|eukprot:EOB12107.1 DNA polymerase epsilon catalytic subunit A [Nosema bombycis CQ1]